jgi:hypothetical protein
MESAKCYTIFAMVYARLWIDLKRQLVTDIFLKAMGYRAGLALIPDYTYKVIHVSHIKSNAKVIFCKMVEWV